MALITSIARPAGPRCRRRQTGARPMSNEPIDLDELEDNIRDLLGWTSPELIAALRELRASRKVVEAARRAAEIYKCYDCDAPQIMNKAISVYDATVTDRSAPE